MATSQSSDTSSKGVSFTVDPHVQYFETLQPLFPGCPRRSKLIMNEIISQKYSAGQVTDSMLQEATVLFNENYGVWGEHGPVKPGNRVRLSKNRPRTEYLLEGAVYVRAIVDGKLAGNAFACRRTTGEKNVLWITQLVVHRSYRERGIARRLLDHLVEVDIDIYGLMSSHPAACVAAARFFEHLSALFQSISLDVLSSKS